MILDEDLIARLSAKPFERFNGEVFRATSRGANPLTSSVNGGRWAPRASDGADFSILYTSFQREGALAEIVSYWKMLTPMPTSRPIKVSRLSVSASRIIRLVGADLQELGVDVAQYGSRDYARTQSIGAVLAYLGIDGLIAPCARWPCDNLMLYTNNLEAGAPLEEIDHEEVTWLPWAITNGLIEQ